MKALLTSVVLALYPAVAHAQPERVIPREQAVEDAALAQRAVEMIHPGFGRYTARAEVAAGFDELMKVSERGPTEREFYGVLSRALARIRCSHTKAEPSEAWVKWRKLESSYMPFKCVERDGRMIVVRSAVNEVNAGDEVLTIDGASAGEVMARVLAMTPADGWTESAKRFALFSMSDLDESEWDHYLPVVMKTGERVRLEVRGERKRVSRSITVPMLTREARRLALSEVPPARNLDEAVSLDVKPDGVAVMRIGTFVAYRKPIKPEAIYRPLFERLAAERVSTLILDLRDNGGGSDEAAIDLMRFLVAEPLELSTKSWVKTFRFGDLVSRLETWDRSVLNMPEEQFRDLGTGYFEVQRGPERQFGPLEPGFRGRVIALFGPANASGATLFLAGLRARRAVTLVGEPTGGSVEGPTAGIILFLPLPNTGIKVRIPAIRSVTGLVGGPGGGLDPDVLVRPEIGDILEGRDVVLLRAIATANEAEARTR